MIPGNGLPPSSSPDEINGLAAQTAQQQLPSSEQSANNGNNTPGNDREGTKTSGFSGAEDVSHCDNVVDGDDDDDDDDEDDSGPDTRYGLGRWAPSSLQKFATLWGFIKLYIPCAVLKVSIIQYTRTQVTPIEDYFRINSSKSGILICAVDIGSVAFALIGAHFGRFTHIPRLLAASAVGVGIAAMAISVVQMAKPRSLPSDPASLTFGSINSRREQELLNDLCWTQATAERFNLPFNLSNDFDELARHLARYREENYDEKSNDVPWTYFYTIGCLIVAGAFISYKLAIQTFFIEQNVAEPRLSGNYIGVIQAAMIFGSPVALFFSAFIHRVPVDVEHTSMSTSDPRWVSAWWLGYVIIGCMLVVFSGPVFLLPRRISKANKMVKKDQTNGKTDIKPDGAEWDGVGQGGLRNSHNGLKKNTNGLLINNFPSYNSNKQTSTLTTSPGYVSDTERPREFYDTLQAGEKTQYFSCKDAANVDDIQKHQQQNSRALSNTDPNYDKLQDSELHQQIPSLQSNNNKHKPNKDKETVNGIYKKQTRSDSENNSMYSSDSNGGNDLTHRADRQDLEGVELSLEEKLKSWPETIKRLMSNPVIVLMMIEGIFFYIGLLGPVAFQLKYLEDQFDESASKISLYLGIGQLSTAVLGTYLGGHLTSRFNMSRVEMFKASLATQVIALILSTSFVILGCDNHDIVGLNEPLRSDDEENCLCANNSILFLCGSDGKNYLSPCIAGCKDIDDLDYRNCSRIANGGTATPGFCDNDCHTFLPLICIYVVLVFISTIGLAPRTLMICRSVKMEDESLANGLINGFVVRCAAIAGPILFGQLYDNTCILWPQGNGSCKVANKDDLRRHFQATGIALRAVGVAIMVVVTIFVCQQDKNKDRKDDEIEIIVSEPEDATEEAERH